MGMASVDAILKEAAIKKGWLFEAQKEGIEKGIEKGIERGIEKGKMDNAAEVAREMLLDGEKIEKIAKWTKLPIYKIKELQECILKQV